MSRRFLTSAWAALWLPAATLAQTPAEPAPPAAEAQRSLLPGLKLPELGDLHVTVPRPVQAVTALVGLGRPRLALVIGNARLGSDLALGAAPRDTQAVAAALRAGGFVVMVREDLGLDDLRANLKEFHDRLQPGSVGFLYFTGLGLQADGQNLLLPRAGKADDLKGTALPLQELIDAAQGTAGAPRFLVVDAAFAHDALAGLGKPGLAPQRLPPGVMALFSNAPDAVQAPPTPDALPQPAPTDPRVVAASPFARELVRSLVTPRRSGAEVLRQARNAVLDASQGRQSPWIAGDSTDKDDFAEPNLLDAFLPRTPEEMAREAAKLAARAATSRSAAPTAAPAGEAIAPMSAPEPAPDLSHAPRARVPVASAPAAAGTAATASAGAGAALLPGAVGVAGSIAALAIAAGDMPVSAFASPPPPPPKPAPVAPPAPAPAPVVDAAPARPAPPTRGVGERPVYTPRVNPFGYAEGDTYTYRVLDKWKNEVTGMVVQTIDEILPDGQFRANGAATQFDAQGRVKSTRNADGSVSDYEPAQELYWPNPRRGESRKVDFGEDFRRADRSSGHTEWSGSMSVGRATKIQLPAGEYEVLPIEGSGWYRTKTAGGMPFSGQWSRTVWYSTQLGHPVAIDIEDADRTGRLLRRERVELVHAQTQKSR